MKKRAAFIIVLLAVVSANLYFGLPRLKTFAGIDEPLWSYGRVPQLWKAVKEGKWKKTDLCDKPGVTLAAVSGIGLIFSDNPKELEKLHYQQKTPEQIQKITDLYYYLRLPVFFFTLLTLPIFYFLIKKLAGRKTALLSLIFIGLSPVLLGISLMVNTDAILRVLLPLNILSFLVYQKENNKKYLYLSGVLLGLGIITKYVVNVLFPFFLLLIYLKYVFDGKTEKDPRTYFKKALADYGIMVLISLAVVAALFPAVWVKPKMLLNATIFSKAFHRVWREFFAVILVLAAETYLLRNWLSAPICNFLNRYRRFFSGFVYAAAFYLIGYALYNTYSGMELFDFQPLFNFPGNSDFEKSMLSSFYPLLFGLTPLAALFFILTLLGNFWQKKSWETYCIFTLLFFMLIYYAGSALNGVGPTVRYQIVLYPLACIIAAIGIVQAINSKFLKKYLTEFNFYLLLAALFVFSIFSLKSIQPFYLSYASDLLPKKYVLNFRDMGDGSWEAAQYLNNLPDAKNLSIWADKGAVCEYFVGKCNDSLKEKGVKNTQVDYFMISAGRQNKSLAWGAERKAVFSGGIKPKEIYFPDNPAEFRLNIDNRPTNFIKIIKALSVIPQ
ncbi:MAG: 2 protein [Patescibacteria group bacterium]|nr:2 protein [Patescibacteria group bacterium]